MEKKKFEELTETEQKELWFQLNSRCLYIPGFYEQLQELVNTSENPFDETGHVRTLKPEFHENT